MNAPSHDNQYNSKREIGSAEIENRAAVVWWTIPVTIALAIWFMTAVFSIVPLMDWSEGPWGWGALTVMVSLGAILALSAFAGFWLGHGEGSLFFRCVVVSLAASSAFVLWTVGNFVSYDNWQRISVLRESLVVLLCLPLFLTTVSLGSIVLRNVAGIRVSRSKTPPSPSSIRDLMLTTLFIGIAFTCGRLAVTWDDFGIATLTNLMVYIIVAAVVYSVAVVLVSICFVLPILRAKSLLLGLAFATILPTLVAVVFVVTFRYYYDYQSWEIVLGTTIIVSTAVHLSAATICLRCWGYQLRIDLVDRQQASTNPVPADKQSIDSLAPGTHQSARGPRS